MEDAYFECETLNARILISACERNRTHKPKNNEYNRCKVCKKCDRWEGFQKETFPMEEVHTRALAFSAMNPEKPKKRTALFLETLNVESHCTGSRWT